MRTAKKPKPLYLRYEIDSDVHERCNLTPMSWRAVMMFAAAEGIAFVCSGDCGTLSKSATDAHSLRNATWYCLALRSIP